MGTQKSHLNEMDLFEHPKHMLKLMGKKILTILCSKTVYHDLFQNEYSKACPKGLSKKEEQKIVFKTDYRLMQAKSIHCRMLK